MSSNSSKLTPQWIPAAHIFLALRFEFSSVSRKNNRVVYVIPYWLSFSIIAGPNWLWIAEVLLEFPVSTTEKSSRNKCAFERVHWTMGFWFVDQGFPVVFCGFPVFVPFFWLCFGLTSLLLL